MGFSFYNLSDELTLVTASACDKHFKYHKWKDANELHANDLNSQKKENEKENRKFSQTYYTDDIDI